MNTMDLFDLNEKVICITGGYGYLGTAISNGLADFGANVIVIGRSRNKFEAVFAKNSNINFHEGDISDTNSIKACFKSIFNQYGAIDVLINNAFYTRGINPESITDEDWTYSMDGTIGAINRCIREYLPFLKMQRGGNIINVASMYGIVSPDFTLYRDHPEYTNPPHYGAGKAAVIQLTRYFATLLGKENVRVNAVSPGPFPSKDIQESIDFIAALGRRTLLGRIGNPEELAGPFIFLCSDASAYMTGQNLVIDGGWICT